LLDDFLRSLDNVLGLVVLFLFLGPFFVSLGLVGVEFGDLLFEEGLEVLLVLQELVLLITDGDLLLELGLELLGSGLSLFDFLLEGADVIITLVLESLDERIIGVLFGLKVVLDVLQHVDQIFNWVTRLELELDGVQEGLSELGLLDLLQGVVSIILRAVLSDGTDGQTGDKGNNDEFHLLSSFLEEK